MYREKNNHHHQEAYMRYYIIEDREKRTIIYVIFSRRNCFCFLFSHFIFLFLVVVLMYNKKFLTKINLIQFAKHNSKYSILVVRGMCGNNVFDSGEKWQFSMHSLLDNAPNYLVGCVIQNLVCHT